MTLKEVIAVFGERASQYETAVVLATLVRPAGENEPRLLRGAVRFARGSLDGPARLDYGRLVLERRLVTPAEGIAFIEEASTGGYPNGYGFNIPAGWRFENPSWLYPSHLPGALGRSRFSDWPARAFVLVGRENVANAPDGPLASPDLPLIMDPNSRIDEWTGVNHQHANMSNGLAIFLPDFRVRIRRVRFEERSVTVDIETNTLLLGDSGLAVKAAVGYSGRPAQEVPVANSAGQYRIETRLPPSTFTFLAMLRPTGEVLDWAQVHLGWTDLPSEVEFALPGRQLTQLIDGGETDEVEFKEELSDGGHKVFQSVVAFANTKGGTILVGVTDNGDVVGTTAEKDRLRVEEWVDGKCDPPIELRFEIVRVGERDVLVIQVPVGTNPPYQHRGNGVPYVRRGATDRPARRSELDALYERRRSGGSKYF